MTSSKTKSSNQIEYNIIGSLRDEVVNTRRQLEEIDILISKQQSLKQGLQQMLQIHKSTVSSKLIGLVNLLTSNAYKDNFKNMRQSTRELSQLQGVRKSLASQLTSVETLVSQLQAKKNIELLIDLQKAPVMNSNPRVSIIILTHDGVNHLQCLFKSILRNTSYQNFEIILVDNASTEDIKSVVKEFIDLKIQVIRNDSNLSFSQANNDAVEHARGELLLFLNNDIEVTRNWLSILVLDFQSRENIGALGPRLVYPFKDSFSKSYMIQHEGIDFKNEGDFRRPVNLQNGTIPSTATRRVDKIRAATGACLMVSTKTFLEVGGFDQAYNYGYEDVDLCLKLTEKGFKNFITTNCLLFHYEFGSQEKNLQEEVISRREHNKEYFKSKWPSI